ncbi:hypothetical protein D9611_011925 [Ephemerocybe angulata]|uniref:DNA recombination and repair protein Rad51-like C-terminal domain-containing protein n=1 Tax=Ephemerocybe angulata TaxID=980116 RepID=A0A8H5FFH6_9AGAR|nr:hypothetical protein D9611_011925 [Tulosesus angulatus]
MVLNRSILSLGLPRYAITALTAAGYESLQDLTNVTAEELAQDLYSPLEVAEHVLAIAELCRTIPSTPRVAHAAAALVRPAHRTRTGCKGLDAVLRGGLHSGHILELAGLPGTPTEYIAMNLMERFVEDGKRLIIAGGTEQYLQASLFAVTNTSLDCQNMIDRTFLMALTQRASNDGAMIYTKPQTLAAFMLFIEQLPDILKMSPQATLIVLSSLTSSFHILSQLSPSNRKAILLKVKQVLARLTATNHVSVVITSEISSQTLRSAEVPAEMEDDELLEMSFSYLGPGSAHIPLAEGKTYLCVPRFDVPSKRKILESCLHAAQPNNWVLETAVFATI